ncbi:MAG: carboxynorspermidine decarboxylase [Candidatus Hydrogenedentota bacterium]
MTLTNGAAPLAANDGFEVARSVDVTNAPSPCYICDMEALERNLAILDRVRERTNCRILLALKGFAMHSVFPTLRRTLHGVAASSLDEARLGAEAFGGETHVYAPAYKDEEFSALLELTDHITFNSFNQWKRFKPLADKADKAVSFGLRINPEHSEVATRLYDPSAPGSRLGVPRGKIEPASLKGLEGLHFHNLCGLNADALERTLEAVEKGFGMWMEDMKWVNFGGGHHISRADYDVDLLCELIHDFQEGYGVQVYIEPGEAVALNAGVLVATVLDIVENAGLQAILDTSATAHMPDVLEMPYRPDILGAGQRGDYPHSYRLGGVTCLAGDIIGDYSFPEPLEVGQKLVFTDMAHYTMVKNTTFNGIRLPSIAIHDRREGGLQIVREFSYEDYKDRLS